MSSLTQLSQHHLIVYALILTRIGGLVAVAPVLGSRSVPIRLRCVLAAGIALLIAPLFWNQAVPSPTNLLGLLSQMGNEAIVGLALGMGVSILLSGLYLAGQLISQLSGMALSDVVDPTWNMPVPAVARLLEILTVAVFLVIGGHRQVLDALLQTFQWLPPGHGHHVSGPVTAVAEIMTQSFVLGLRAGAPMIVALLIATLATGLISRTLPQLNFLSIGLSLNVALLLIVASLSLTGMTEAFQDHLQPAVDTILGMFSGSSPLPPPG